MSRPKRLLLSLATLGLAAHLALAAEETGSEPASPTPSASPAAEEAPTDAASPVEPAPELLPAGTFTEAERAAAVRLDSLTVPTSGELLTAIGKVAQPNWQSVYRKPIPTSFTSRAQIALNLGGLIADGYLAVEAADAQQVKNIGRDIINLARSLGVSENVLGRGGSISDFADNNEWSVLKEELEATQNEVKMAMKEQGDEDLIVMVTIGGWIRGTEIVSAWLAANYDANAAKLLRQPGIVSFMRGKIEALPERMRKDPLVKKVDGELGGIGKLVTFPIEEPPAREHVDQLRVAVSQLVEAIVNPAVE